MRSYKEIPYLVNETSSSFRNDVVKGLSAHSKYLEPKYFYDAAGDRLFQQIMQSPQYYLTRAEMEILNLQSGVIIEKARSVSPKFDIIELGSGDATKSVHLLKEALAQGCSDRYFPIDISGSMILELENRLPALLPGVRVKGLAGEYFAMLDKWHKENSGPKLVLFLGATIGNMLPGEALDFCKSLHGYLDPGDLVLMGFDLKKNPAQVLEAYNDPAGITRAFNLNLLKRINRELGADFDPDQFEHYATYDPGSGACKSFLVSKKEQTVTLEQGQGPRFNFASDEVIYMEVSQKYDEQEIDEMGLQSGFTPVAHYYDSGRLFMDTLWKVPA